MSNSLVIDPENIKKTEDYVDAIEELNKSIGIMIKQYDKLANAYKEQQDEVGMLKTAYDKLQKQNDIFLKRFKEQNEKNFDWYLDTVLKVTGVWGFLTVAWQAALIPLGAVITKFVVLGYVTAVLTTAIYNYIKELIREREMLREGTFLYDERTNALRQLNEEEKEKLQWLEDNNQMMGDSVIMYNKYRNSVELVSKAQYLWHNHLREEKAEMKDLTSNYNDLINEQERLTVNLDSSSASLQKQKRFVEETVAAQEEFSDSQKIVSMRLTDSIEKYDEFNLVMQQVGNGAKVTGIHFRGFIDDSNNLSAKFDSMSDSLAKGANAVNSFGSAPAIFTNWSNSLESVNNKQTVLTNSMGGVITTQNSLEQHVRATNMVLEVQKDAIKDEIMANDHLSLSQKGVLVSLVDSIKKYDRCYLAIEQLNKGSDKTKIEFAALSDASNNLKHKLIVTKSAVDSNVTGFGNLSANVKNNADVMKQNKKELEEHLGTVEEQVKAQEKVILTVPQAIEAFDFYNATMNALKGTISDVSKKMDDNTGKTESNSNATDKAKDKVAKMTDEQKKLADKTAETTDKNKEFADSMTNTGTKLEKFAKHAKQAVDLLKQTGAVSDKTAEALGEIADGVGTVGKGFSQMAKDPISGTLNVISGSFKALNGIIKLFAGDGVGEAIARERQFIEISKEMEEQIRKVEEQIGDTHAAISLFMGDIIEDANVKVHSFDNYAKRVGEIVLDLDRGKITMKQFQQTMGESWNALLQEAERLGIKASREMIDILRNLRERGLEVAEIQEWVNEKLREGIDALNEYLNTFADSGDIEKRINELTEKLDSGDLTKKERIEAQQKLIELQQELANATADVTANWEFMQLSTMGLFAGLQLEGNTFMESVVLMKDELDALAKMAVDNGLEISAELQAMTNMSTFISQNEMLAKRIDETNKIMISLGDTATLSEEAFASFGNQAISQFEEIMKHTDDQELALRLISPTLESLITYADEYEYQIDEATQALIDQAKKAGVLEERKHIELGVTNELLLGIADALGAHIPDSIRKMSQAYDESLNGIHNQNDQWDRELNNVEDRLTNSMPDAVEDLDNEYKKHMTGNTIVKDTYKWKHSLDEIHQILTKDLIEASGRLDGNYSHVMGNLDEYLENTSKKAFKTTMTFDQMVDELERLQGAYNKLAVIENRTDLQNDQLADYYRQVGELTEAIKESMAEYAESINTFIENADINADNFSQYVKKSMVILEVLEKGAVSAKKSQEIIGQTFNTLLGEAQKLGMEGSKNLLVFMDKVKASGLEVAEIQQYVNDQLNSGVDAFGKYLNSFGDISGVSAKMDEVREQMKTAKGKEYRDLEAQLAEHQAEMDKLTGEFGSNFDSAGTYATAMFSSLVAEGATFMEAMEQMGPQLQQLSDMAQASGVEVSGSVKELLDMQDFIDQNQEVTERISATTEMMTALGNSGYLTGDIFNTFQEDAQAHLKDLGVDMNNLTEGTDQQKEAFQLMGPELAKLLWYSEQYGYELDGNTKKMIAQAEQHGVNMEAMLPPEQQMVNLLEELVDLFSERLPKATDDMADKTEMSLKNMKKETGKWKEELESVEGKLNNGLQDAVNSLDEEYKNAMTGNTIVAETMKWKGSLEEVEEILGRELMEKADDLDKKYSFVHGNIRQYLKDTSKEGFMANMTFDQMVDELVRLQDAHDTLAMKKRRRKNEDQMLDDYKRQINELSAAIKESAPTMENFQKHFRELKDNLSGDIGVNAEMIAFTKELKAQGKTLDDIDKQIQDSLTKGAKGLGVWVDALGPSGKQIEEIKKMQEELETLNEKETLSDAELEKKTELETTLPDLLKTAKDAMTVDMAAFGDTQDILLSYFYSLQAEGKSVAEIMDLMGDSFEAVAAKSLEGEISPEMNSSFAKLYDLQRKIADNEGLIKGIESLSGALHGMGDSMLYMNEDTFGSFERSAMATFQKLKRAGFDETQSLQMVAPLLRDLEAYAAEYGYTLDGSVGSLLERAKASKLIQQEQKSDTERLIDANERLADVMTDMTKMFTDMGDNTPFSIMDEQARKLGISLKDLRQDMMRLISMEAGVVNSPATEGYTSAALGYHGVLGSDRWFRLHKGERVDVWTSEETQRIKATPIRRMNLSDESASERRGDIVFEHITIQSENGEEAVREFMTAIKGNRYGVQNLIRKVAQ